MEHYQLKPHEVVLYKGEINFANQEDITQLILTNLNTIYKTTHKKIFGDDEISVEVYSIQDIKIYEETPQIIAKGHNVDIYYLTTEKELYFKSKSEVSKFVNAAMKLLTGKSTAQRRVEKVKQTIDMVDNTLGIDTIGATKEALHNGVSNATSNIVSAGANKLVKIGKNLLTKNKSDNKSENSNKDKK